MARMKMVGALLLIVYVSLVGAQIHHVVGGDRGSTKASEVQEWLFDKVFKVGDKLCESCDRSLYDEKREKEREVWERRHCEREESDENDFFFLNKNFGSQSDSDKWQKRLRI